MDISSWCYNRRSTKIDAGKPTANPLVKADYYLIGYAKWPSGNWKTAYLNSNAMKQLKVEVTSNQLEFFK